MKNYVETIANDKHATRLTDVFVPEDVGFDLLRLRVGKRREKGKLIRLIRPCIKDDRDHPLQLGWLGEIAVHRLPPAYKDASLVLVAMSWKDDEYDRQ